jgi:hypothetical protein
VREYDLIRLESDLDELVMDSSHGRDVEPLARKIRLLVSFMIKEIRKQNEQRETTGVPQKASGTAL